MRNSDSKYLVSIIIPVYNVEKYLKKCVESIIHQSFDKYEVILVDDGSSDQGGAICDQFANRFANVSAYHRVNEGLSAARNFGVLKAKADYVIFVDSDDYVDSSYVSELWDLIVKFKVQIAVTGFKKENEAGQITGIISPSKEVSIPSAAALKKMCYGAELPIMAVGKIYNRRFLLSHPYPLGKLHEDIATTYLLLDSTPYIALGPSASYHYIQRKESIVNQRFSPQHLYSLEASMNVIEYFRKWYPGLLLDGYGRLALESVAIIHRTFRASKADYKKVGMIVRKLLENHWKEVFKNKCIPNKTRIQLLLFKNLPFFYRNIYITFDKFRDSVKR